MKKKITFKKGYFAVVNGKMKFVEEKNEKKTQENAKKGKVCSTK